MAKKSTRGPERERRREDALSRERIVDAAIELLDADGEDGLTFRALATRLATGPGAIYWHVTNKGELLVAATDAVVARAMGEVARLGHAARSDPSHRARRVRRRSRRIRGWARSSLANSVGDGDAADLRAPRPPGRGAGRSAGGAQFTAASTLLSYVIGVSLQNAAASQFARRELAPSTNRVDFLEAAAARLARARRP